MREVTGAGACIENSGVIPGLGEGGRHAPLGRVVVGGRERAAFVRHELLGIELLDAAEAAELALHSIEISVVERLQTDEVVSRDEIVNMAALDYMHGKRKARNPRPAGGAVGEIELGGRRVLEQRFAAEIVPNAREQMRLAAAHQVHIPQGTPGIGGQRRGPQDARGAASEKMRDGDGVDIAREKAPQLTGRRKRIPRLVQINIDARGGDVQDIGGAGAIGVRQPDSLLVEHAGVVEPWRAIHGDFAAETRVAEIGPVANLAVADAHNIGQPVAGHVGEIDGLLRVGEDHPRAFFFVVGGRNAPFRTEALVEKRRMPAERDFLSHQNVGDSIAGYVDEFQIGIVPVERRERFEEAELRPSFAGCALVKTAGFWGEFDHVHLAVAGDVHELLARRGQRRGGRAIQEFGRSETASAEIALVVPAAAMIGKDAGDTFAIEVDPAVIRAVDTLREVLGGGVLEFEAIELGIFQGTCRKLELQRGQASLEIQSVGAALVPGVQNAGEQRYGALRRVFQFGGTHHAIRRPEFFREMMKHQDAPAQAVGSHFKAGTVGGEGVLARRPPGFAVRGGIEVGEDSSFAVGRQIAVVFFAVIQHHRKHPRRVGPWRFGSQRYAVAVSHAFQMAVGVMGAKPLAAGTIDAARVFRRVFV